MTEVNNNIGRSVQAANHDSVYVMPDRFRLDKSSGSNNGIIISALVLLMVIFMTVGYFFYDNWQRSVASQKTENVPNPPIIEIQEEEGFASSLAPASMEETATSTDAVMEEPSVYIPESVEIGFSPDSDNDGLTDVEEIIFGTISSNPDTDGDGYKDGVEVINGYSPTKAGSFKISDSPFITSMATDFDSDNFKLFYPKDWRISLSKASKQLALTVNTGEVISVAVKDNPDKIPAMSWYLQMYPQVSVSQLRIVDSKDLTGIYSPDGFSAFLTDKDKSKIYIFEYIIGKQSEFRYPSIFAMLIKQFEVISDSGVVATLGGQSSTGEESSYTASSCANFFCATTPCGLQPNGGNSCESSPPRGVCYLRACESDLDCSDGLSCQEVDCYSGDSLISSSVCK